MASNLRAVIVGASTLLGKELIEELNSTENRWNVRLADAANAGGQLMAGGDEALVVHSLTPDVFEGRDVAFFAEGEANTRNHWREARTAKVRIIDLTGVLVSESGALIRSPWIAGGKAPDASTTAVIPAHPAAVMLGVVGSRLKKAFDSVLLAATVLEPASQQGPPGMDELHQQTVSLLGFHSLPQEHYDSQVAFNLRIGVGEAAKLNPNKIAETIRRDLRAVAGGEVAALIPMQLVLAPVFHGYTISAFVRLPPEVQIGELRHELGGGVVSLTDSDHEAPTNQSVTQESSISIAVREDRTAVEEARGFWLWMAADNLKLSARHAVACAEEFCTVPA